MSSGYSEYERHIIWDKKGNLIGIGGNLGPDDSGMRQDNMSGVTKITIDDVTEYVIAKNQEIGRLKHLCSRAADALEEENHLLMEPRIKEVMDELRKAAQ